MRQDFNPSDSDSALSASVFSAAAAGFALTLLGAGSWSVDGLRRQSQGAGDALEPGTLNARCGEVEMLGSARLVAFVATADAVRSRAFYEGILGLQLLSEDRFALVFDSNGSPLRIQKMEQVRPAPFTVLGWQVERIRETVSGLAERGVVFERYTFMQQDELGIWRSPSGAKVAWFKDPDGNVLSVTEW